MFFFLLNYKFFYGFIIMMLILLLSYSYNIKIVKSSNEFFSLIHEMFSNFQKIKHAYNKCLNQNIDYKYLRSAENELKNLGFIDVYNSWPKDTLKKIYEDENEEIQINEEDLDIIKNYFCIVKKFFNQHKDENFKYRKSESEFENQVNKIIDSFLLMTLQPTSDLLIILLNFLKNLEDDTFEHERELITQSQKLYSEYIIFDKYLNKNK